MQLNPTVLREPTRYDVNYTGNTIGHDGESLSAALYRLYHQDAYILEHTLTSITFLLLITYAINVRVGMVFGTSVSSEMSRLIACHISGDSPSAK